MEPDWFVWFEPRNWMHKDFRYPPPSPVAVRLREAIKPGPDYVPHMKADLAAARARIAELEARLTNQSA